MKTEHTQTPKVTLQWVGESGDGKRAFVTAKENDGWQDLRIEVDTDDCDGAHAKAAMQVVIDRNNQHDALVALLTDMLFAAENADETGYVTDVGFIKDFDTLYDRCRAALQSPAPETK